MGLINGKRWCTRIFARFECKGICSDYYRVLNPTCINDSYNDVFENICPYTALYTSNATLLQLQTKKKLSMRTNKVLLGSHVFEQNSFIMFFRMQTKYYVHTRTRICSIRWLGRRLQIEFEGIQMLIFRLFMFPMLTSWRMYQVDTQNCRYTSTSGIFGEKCICKYDYII